MTRVKKNRMQNKCFGFSISLVWFEIEGGWFVWGGHPSDMLVNK